MSLTDRLRALLARNDEPDGPKPEPHDEPDADDEEDEDDEPTDETDDDPSVYPLW
jgi:hypothetical protein